MKALTLSNFSPLNNVQIKAVTSSAIEYFNQYDFDELKKDLPANVINLYDKAIEQYPIAWQALLKLANMKEQVVNTTKATSGTLAQFVYDNSQNLKISVSVCNGYSLSFDPQLSDILNKISSREMETFFVDSSKMLTRNFEKYLHVLEIILGNNGVFCTCNYYISNTCLEKEDAF